jgi:integrase
MISDKIVPDKKGNVKTKPGHSRTTVGIYLRPLRALFNSAISLKEIDPAIYPFGKRLYQIPKGHKVKKVLSSDQLVLLREAKPKTPEQIEAHDLWLFSFNTCGMNLKDICLLKNEDLKDDCINFYRAKTHRTNPDQHLNSIPLTEFTKSIVEKYRNSDQSPKAFLFPFLSPSDTTEQRRTKIKNKTKFINQHIKKLAVSIGLTKEISYYWGRHTYATLAIQNGASMEFVGETLSHSNVKTTQNYFAGFQADSKKEMLNKLINLKI